MPIFDYECAECGAKYDIFHKGKEITEDVVCPKCGSPKHTKLMSVPAAPHMGNQSLGDAGPSPCDSCCANGSCGMN